MKPLLIPTAEPFFFPGNPTACLLIHGFTATPREMRGLGEYLHATYGYTVLGVRLAGHATTPEDMAHMHWEDWLASAEDGWHLLRSAGHRRIAVVGLSMGGVVALLLAAYQPVMAVVSMAAPYALEITPRERLWGLLRPYLPKGEGKVYDPEGFRGRVAYPVNPARSALQLVKMLGVLREALPTIDAPALVLHSRNDCYVPPENAERIYAALGSPRKQLVWVERSSHVVTLDAERAKVRREVGAFIARVALEDGSAPAAPLPEAPADDDHEEAA